MTPVIPASNWLLCSAEVLVEWSPSCHQCSYPTFMLLFTVGAIFMPEEKYADTLSKELTQALELDVPILY